jgi:hypothetical protein
LRRALSPFLLALHAGLANRSRHGAHPVSILSWTSVTFPRRFMAGTGCIAVNRPGRLRFARVRAESCETLMRAKAELKLLERQAPTGAGSAGRAASS